MYEAADGTLWIGSGGYSLPGAVSSVLAVQARHQLQLDRVLFVVANVPWMKAGSRAISPGSSGQNCPD